MPVIRILLVSAIMSASCHASTDSGQSLLGGSEGMWNRNAIFLRCINSGRDDSYCEGFANGVQRNIDFFQDAQRQNIILKRQFMKGNRHGSQSLPVGQPSN